MTQRLRLQDLLPCLPHEGPPVPRFTRRPPTQETHTPETPPASAPAPARPGCTAADNAGVALYHLEGLAIEGKPNFGVLQVTKERLEEGAAACDYLGQEALAQQMRHIAEELPRVHDALGARRLARELRPLAYKLWDLGAKCTESSLTLEDLLQTKRLAHQVHTGEITLEEGKQRIRKR